MPSRRRQKSNFAITWVCFPLFLLPFISLEGRTQTDLKRWDRHVEVGGDFVFISRAQFRNQTITYDPTDSADSNAITTRSLGHKVGFSPGAQVTLGYRPFPQHLVAASLMMLAEPWRAEKQYSNPGELSFPFNSTTVPFDFNAADSSNAKWHGDFWQTGLDYTYDLFQRRNNQLFCQMAFAAKYIYYSESLNVDFTKLGQTGQYSIHTRNDLYGTTIGVNLGYFFLHCLEWSIGVRLGLFANAARCHGYLNDRGGSLLIRDFDHHKWRATGLIAGSVGIKFYPTSFIDIKVEYFGEKIAGVAETAGNINRNVGTSQPIRTGGYTVIDGLIAGINFAF